MLPLMRKRVVMTLGMTALIVAGCGASGALSQRATRHRPSGHSPMLGKKVVMDLPSDIGALVSIGGGGQPLVLDFWAPSCAPCQKKLPELVAREGDLRAVGARLILVAVLSDGESTEMARETLASWGVQRPFLVDREDVSRRAAGVTELPATLILNTEHIATWVASVTTSAEDVVKMTAAARNRLTYGPMDLLEEHAGHIVQF